MIIIFTIEILRNESSQYGGSIVTVVSYQSTLLEEQP